MRIDFHSSLCISFLFLLRFDFMVSTRRKKAVVSMEFIDDSVESDGNETYEEEGYVSRLRFPYFQFAHQTLSKFV